VAALYYPTATWFSPHARAERLKAPAKETDMNKKLYVGNLSSEATEEELRFNFSQAGNVLSVSLIKDRMTGLTRASGSWRWKPRRVPGRPSRTSTAVSCTARSSS
jgi:hypothetical protein